MQKKRVRIDERFCGQVGTDKQHGYCCVLASKLGYSALRYMVSDAMGINVSKCGRTVFTMRDASKIIEWCQQKIKDEEREAKRRREESEPTLFPMEQGTSAIEEGR